MGLRRVSRGGSRNDWQKDWGAVIPPLATVHPAPLISGAVLLVALAAVCLRPLRSDLGDDAGDGRTAVVIPRHVRTSRLRPRTLGFLATAALLGLFFIGWLRPQLPALYAQAVGILATTLSGRPGAVAGYVSGLLPATQFLGITYIVSLSLVIRASWPRRLVVIGHAGLYLAMSMLADALMIELGLETGWPIGPFAIEATFTNLVVGALVVLRVTYTTFALPRPTALRHRRPMWMADTFLTWCALVVALSILVASYAVLGERAMATSELQVWVPMYALSILFVLIFAPLRLLACLNRRRPPAAGERPPVTIIVPAYNEEENIARLLRSTEAAAARYGGCVRVVVANDGSTDATEEIARRELACFRHASGQVLSGPNLGQAGALNTALLLVSTEVVVRIDADCVMGETALLYATPWFRDPRIGSVGAVMAPRTDTVTWFHRLRAIETLFQFRYARMGQGLVDGITVVPGTFTAFRASAAREVGGYATGMNGEDADLTMQLGRLGYRVVIDPRIVSYEDVPRGPGEFVEQRTRWARAGFHVFARHNPLRVGLAGPRVWFWTVRRAFSWFSIQVGLVAPIYIAELAVTHPTYRRTVVTAAVLYVAAGALPLAVSIPLAIRHHQWRSLPWLPTWFAFAFLRRLATLEAVISLPARPLLAHRGGRAREPAGPAPPVPIGSPASLHAVGAGEGRSTVAARGR